MFGFEVDVTVIELLGDHSFDEQEIIVQKFLVQWLQHDAIQV